MPSSFSNGLGRVLRAPWLIAGLWFVTVLLALPLAIALRGMMATHLEGSLAAEAALHGVNFDWWNEFLAQAAGLGQTFVPAVLGFAAVLKNLSDVADARGLPIVIGSAVGANMVLSVFLLGGVLDRLARNRTLGATAFFAVSGGYFFRFLRLGAGAALIYWLLFAKLHPWLFDDVIGGLTREVNVERTAFAYRAAGYALFGLLVLAVNLVLDYAKVRTVVEDRRSVAGAVLASMRFIARHPGATISLYLANLVLFLLVIAIYALVVPSASSPAWAIFLAGQAYIVLRVIVRLQFAASQIAFFQGQLAHAGYTAAPVPAWPESASAEAVSVASSQ